ncbi:MAG: FeoB-associated Cys-rich membrane protein [Firmicutes bacterium HGW-Firmicutes-1]|jgi:hypothetical protein|nr:MAG: FeoB-associated Cys-rich membrane protein [Firmicutes bacterium HGW-Firmicutes-1]
MEATIIVGLVFGIILLWAFKNTKKDLKEGKCGGCSGCGVKDSCHK